MRLRSSVCYRTPSLQPKYQTTGVNYTALYDHSLLHNHTVDSQHCLPAIVEVQELNLKCARATGELNLQTLRTSSRECNRPTWPPTSQAIDIHRKCLHKFTSKTVRGDWSKEVRQLMKWRLLNLTQNCSIHQFRNLISCIIALSVLKQCDERIDVWGLEVRACLALCTDLPAVDAVYHQYICSSLGSVGFRIRLWIGKVLCNIGEICTRSTGASSMMYGPLYEHQPCSFGSSSWCKWSRYDFVHVIHLTPIA